MIVDTGDPASVAAFLIAVLMAIFAWFDARNKKAQVAALTPGTPEAENPVIVETLPARSWKMSDSTRRWCTFDATPGNRKVIEDQINAAEAQKLTHYFVHFDGGYYEIEYGLLKGGAGNPAGGKADNFVPPPVAPAEPTAAGCPTCPQK